jgi:ElaB protein
METFENGNAEFRTSKQNIKGDLADNARALKATASDELKNFVADVEDVVKRVANVNDNDVARMRAKVQTAISSTKDGLATSIAGVKRQAQQAAKQADTYVHESPWQAIGVTAAIAAVLGLSIGLLAARKQ